MDEITLDIILAPFNFAALQEYVTITKQLNNYGRTAEELETWVAEKRESLETPPQPALTYPERKKQLHPAHPSGPSITRPCECGTSMSLYEVNTTPRNQIGGSYTRQWICPACGEEHFE